jgi:hypothetical protein
MPKPSTIITASAVLMNDATQTLYTNDVCLPLLNLALAELQETFEQNDIPITNETSTAIRVKAGISRIGIDTNPALPGDLIEIKELWESQAGQEQWTPVDKREYLPHQMQNGQLISKFLIWALIKDRITVIPANQDNDLKIDYTSTMFNLPIKIANVNVNMPFTNVETYLEYKTAALCAMFIAENETRAMALDSLAGTSLNRSMGIKVKGMQEIVTRRRPFRAAFKFRRNYY